MILIIIYFFILQRLGVVHVKEFYPLIVKLAEGLIEKKIKFCKVDIDDNDEFCEKCNIKSVPTFIVVKDKKIFKVNGADINKVGNLIKECCKDL